MSGAGKAPDNPVAAMLERAARGMRERAGEATPGPWERPLDVRHKDLVGAALPEDEKPRQWEDGIIPDYMTSGYVGRYRGQRERVGVVQCNTWSDGTHSRKRNGRDLEYIAAMHPGVGLAVAALLEETAERARIELTWRGLEWRGMPCGCDQQWRCALCDDPWGVDGGCQCWEKATAVARTWLGEAASGTSEMGGTT